MPCTYVKASENPRHGVMRSPWPTMMPDRIGIIGSTHGVSDSTRPPRKKRPTRTAMLPWRTIAARLSCSDTIGAAVLAGLPDADGAGRASGGKLLVTAVGGNSTTASFVIGL